MNKKPKYLLRLIIPLMVFIVFILSTFLIVINHVNNSKIENINNLKKQFTSRIFGFQNNLDDLFAINQIYLARRMFAEFILETKLDQFNLIDEKNKIFFSNFNEFVGQDPIVIKGYNSQIVNSLKSKMNNQIVIINGHKIVIYFTLNMGVHEGTIRENKIGVVYLEYDFSSQIYEVEKMLLRKQ